MVDKSSVETAHCDVALLVASNYKVSLTASCDVNKLYFVNQEKTISIKAPLDARCTLQHSILTSSGHSRAF